MAEKLNVTVREEVMSDVMTKYIIEGLPFPLVLHRFTGPDGSHPHDHPWGFTSTILTGGYVEATYSPGAGFLGFITHAPGDSFDVKATDIHRIVQLLDNECWTMVQPGPQERTSGIWDFRGKEGTFFRTWHHDAQWERVL